MPTKKLEVKQFTKDNKPFMFYRYYDDHNENYKYQVYELVESKKVSRLLGAPDNIENRNTPLNTREMCDWFFNKK